MLNPSEKDQIFFFESEGGERPILLKMFYAQRENDPQQINIDDRL